MKSVIVTTSNSALGNPAQRYLDAIERNPDLLPTTKRQYERAVKRAVRDGVDMTDPVTLRDYATTVSVSSALYLRAAIGSWADRMQLAIESQVQPSPESVAEAQAAIMRLNALSRAIRTRKATGEKAHIWLSKQETQRLLTTPNAAEAQGLRDKVCLMLMVGGGLRRNEASQIVWEQFMRQGERWVLAIHGKGAKNRIVPIANAMAEILQSWRTHTGKEGRILRRLYKGGGFGDSLGLTSIYTIVQRYGNRIGHDNLQPHDLRRTYAQIGYENGIPLTQISKLLGHSSLAVTQRYLNIDLNLEETISDFVPFD